MSLLEEDFDQLYEEFEELQVIVDNIDNIPRKNNIKLCDLKEEAEGDNLKAYLECLPGHIFRYFSSDC